MLCRVILLALDGVGPTGVPSVRSMTIFVTVLKIETSTQFSKILVPTFSGHPLILIHQPRRTLSHLKHSRPNAWHSQHHLILPDYFSTSSKEANANSLLQL